MRFLNGIAAAETRAMRREQSLKGGSAPLAALTRAWPFDEFCEPRGRVRMRKSSFLVLVAVLATLAFLGATAAVASASSIYATGAGWESFPPFTGKHFIHFDVSAHTGPQGDFGQVHYSVPDQAFAVTVNVDCVNVFPFTGLQGVAWVGGPITKVTPGFGLAPGDQLAFYAVDGGNPSSTTPVDEFDGFFGSPQVCKALSFIGYGPDVTQGNVNISTG
jgi:hypothetical protein